MLFLPSIVEKCCLSLTVLENGALPLLVGLWRWTEDGPDGLVEHRLEALLGQGGTLEVLHGADVLGHGEALE